MADVCIAVPRRLGARRETSINETDYLPLSNDVAIIRQKFNDNTFITANKTVYIKDSKVRNEQYIEQELVLEERSLVGKKAKVIRPIKHDVGVIQKFNEKCIKKASDLIISHEKFDDYNLVSFPLTAAEKVDFSVKITS